jgi:hypothetical protein
LDTASFVFCVVLHLPIEDPALISKEKWNMHKPVVQKVEPCSLVCILSLLGLVVVAVVGILIYWLIEFQLLSHGFWPTGTGVMGFYPTLSFTEEGLVLDFKSSLDLISSHFLSRRKLLIHWAA